MVNSPSALRWLVKVKPQPSVPNDASGWAAVSVPS
jgi:hypothetical protein